MEIIFAILMFIVFWKLIKWSIKAAWGITKVIVTIILFPLVLIGMVFAGMIYLAIGILIVAGIIAFVGTAVA